MAIVYTLMTQSHRGGYNSDSFNAGQLQTKDKLMASMTVENYLKQIYQQHHEHKCDAGQEVSDLVPMGKLAAAVGVTPGTATSMVKTLTEAGLVDYEPRSGVRLTAAGNSLALQVLRRHRLVELFLVEVVGLDWSEVHDEAEELEHAISEKVLERIDELLGHPQADPHGDPIPTRHGRPRALHRRGLANLPQCPVDRPLVIARVLDQSPAFLRFCEQHGLMPGASLRIVAHEEAAEAIVLSTGDHQQLTLGIAAGAKILVAQADD